VPEATDTPSDNDTTPTSSAPNASHGWLDGEHYSDTEHLSMEQIATSIGLTLDDLQHDDEIPEHLDIHVTADDTGPIAVLRTVIRGLTTQDGVETRDAVMRATFDLASHYNRIHLARPESCRFVHYVFAIMPTELPSAVLVGITTDTLPTAHLPAESGEHVTSTNKGTSTSNEAS
jgi:hypothetical protein